MTGADRGAVGERGDGRIRVRDVVGLLLYLVVGGALLVLGVAGTRWFSRHVAPVLYDLPGGSWAVGGVLGLLSLVGWAGASSSRFESPGADGTGRPARVARVAARGVCWAAALVPVFFLISGLRGRNCRSYEPGCAYISGTGPAVLAYVVVAGGVGWLCHRWRRTRSEERRARERERLRKLRKKGKGKSRGAR
ncbi:hypothetical protein ACFTXB_08195 [Streptomyces sp. NPDC057074]|uniref:hypothetical protein n=1 Tax=Streptomyces sp. NPDC057074 TaxID=3346015 RepID=UPI00364089D2